MRKPVKNFTRSEDRIILITCEIINIVAKIKKTITTKSTILVDNASHDSFNILKIFVLPNKIICKKK